MFAILIAIDLGCDGAMVVIRNVGNGPEVVCPPYSWRFRRRDRFERHKAEVHNHLRPQSPAPVAAGIPAASGGDGGSAQHSGPAARWRLSVMDGGADGADLRAGAAEPQGDPGARAGAEGILRSSFAEILFRDDLRELSGEAGEHVRDACAVALAALARLPRANGRETVGRRAN